MSFRVVLIRGEKLNLKEYRLTGAPTSVQLDVKTFHKKYFFYLKLMVCAVLFIMLIFNFPVVLIDLILNLTNVWVVTSE